jgi:catechol 2,3-dioxygenase-like lactoylglutathione lyase family enzyme
MDRTIPGIHHVTAIAGDPQANLDFYTSFLGLRLVKLTVNFDDTGTYHFYFGNGAGAPGSILTFFPFLHAAPGRPGPGMAAATAFAVPDDSLDYWMGHLAAAARDFDGPENRFGQQVIRFRDPDGLRLELVGDAGAGSAPGWDGGPAPAEHAIRHVHGVALCVEASERTRRLLTETFGYEAVGEEAGRVRLRARGGGPGGIVDLYCQPDRLRGRMGAGSVHHVAFRARDDEEQRAWREQIAALGFNVTPVLDRQYFRSIYFREPGGVLFEIATDPPGFAVDEPVDALGASLKLPGWLEPRRQDIERSLPPLRLPRGAR